MNFDQNETTTLSEPQQQKTTTLTESWLEELSNEDLENVCGGVAGFTTSVGASLGQALINLGAFLKI